LTSKKRRAILKTKTPKRRKKKGIKTMTTKNLTREEKRAILEYCADNYAIPDFFFENLESLMRRGDEIARVENETVYTMRGDAFEFCEIL
jgi:hypothetical protein